MSQLNLPVCTILPEFRSMLNTHNQLILSAAPGAGKTTVIPPETAKLVSGNIRLIEPRRIAAKAAAGRIAELDNSEIGSFSGYAVRGESKRGKNTKILAVTPGILLREFQNNPELEDVDVIIFDEFHERSWECDLLLALALDIQESLRPDLKIIIMSATLATEQLKKFLPGAAVLESSGREYPVEVVYRPGNCSTDCSKIVTESLRAATTLYREKDGDILVFLPGAGETDSAAQALAQTLPDADIRCLHGAVEFKEQSRLLSPSSDGKKRIFLATNIAESSITIDGITSVVDCGWEKRMTYVPASGMPFLELQRISQASACQRSGRAGRTAPGTAIRLYSQVEFNNLIPQRPPELTVCDLAPFVLHLAEWGATVSQLKWLDTPPESGLLTAGNLLRKIGAITQENRLTAHGKKLSQLPLHPRLGSMLLKAKELDLQNTAVAIAAILENRIFKRNTTDLRELLYDIRRNASHIQKTVMRQLTALLGQTHDEITPESAGRLLCFAYPEWIAQKRSGNTSSYRLAGGRAGELSPDDSLLGQEFLAVAVLGGNREKDARIHLASPVDKEELELDFSERLSLQNSLDFDPDTGKVSAKEELHLDNLVLSSKPIPPPPGTAGKAVLASAVKRQNVLPPENFKKANQLLARVRFAYNSDPEAGFPDWRKENYSAVLEKLTAGFLDSVRSISDLLKLNWDSIFEYALSMEQMHSLNKLYPEFFVTKRGYKIRIDYSGPVPTAAVRIQELYGVTVHPVIGRNKIPLRLELLSPARRPVQITMDLPGFWQGSWSLVRRDMRGRYPKHDWPEHPELETTTP